MEYTKKLKQQKLVPLKTSVKIEGWKKKKRNFCHARGHRLDDCDQNVGDIKSEI